MDTTTKIREQLNQILEDVEHREEAIAHALEDLTVDNAIRSCWDQAKLVERDRVLALIDAQIAQVNAAGMNSILLQTLRGVVCDG